MAPEPQSNRLPFEPNKKRQKPDKKSQKQPETAKKSQDKSPATAKKSENQNKSLDAKKSKNKPAAAREELAIPKVVSNRMARRMAVFCGVPTALGMSTFIVSYLIVSQGWFKLPNAAVVLVSMGFFGLGVLGLSYGVISASWDEETVGSRLGWQEFTTNWRRIFQSLKGI